MQKLAALGLLLAASLMFAQSSEIDKAFAEFQRVWTTADKNGAAKVISDDLVWITRRGLTLNKQEVIYSLRPGGGENIRDKKVRLYGEVAVITYADGQGGSAGRRTLLWKKTQDGWKIVSFHTSTIQQ